MLKLQQNKNLQNFADQKPQNPVTTTKSKTSPARKAKTKSDKVIYKTSRPIAGTPKLYHANCSRDNRIQTRNASEN